jgi:hypothetical protein
MNNHKLVNRLKLARYTRTFCAPTAGDLSA